MSTATASARATPSQLAKIRTVPCDYCGVPGDGTPCLMVLRSGKVTRRPMINVHDARLRLAEFRGRF